ncbi:proton-coupled folate transporter [Neocloeon triangulifer]|uniref:proton-coupled folate transporter n=1 Tax=Neocloeon triangulifer TaxID=2078957 RepID=UPI00286EC711|nr:proton-coupled folate transporter [Neocloeon triangulifer]XP_059483677.1 proton-coupled folate transporter [Neocloeon triangulifer]XP_059483678.1 proton-coupled folate transporter [Neocloeon triangulifer]
MSTTTEDESNKKGKWLSYLDQVTTEPVMFLYMFAYMLTSVVEQRFYVDRACRVDLNFSDEICSNIESNSTEKVVVQKYVAAFVQYNNIAFHGVPLVLALFLGAWSDKQGGARKGPMLVGLLGKLFFSIMFAVNAWQSTWPLYTLLWSATLPQAATGADLAIFMAAFSYVADVSSPEQRTLRITMLQASYLITIPTGVAVGKVLFNATGRSVVACFLVNAALVALALIYAAVRLKWRSATRAPDAAKVVEKRRPFLLEFFDRHHLADTIRTVMRKRPGARRAYLWGLLIAMGLYTFHRDESSLMYLYTQLKFNFDLNLYSNFRTYQSGVYVLGILVVLPLMSKLCGVPDAVAVLVGAAAHAAARVVFILAEQPYLLYVGATLSALGPIVAPVIKSMVSKVVPLRDRGKVMALLASADNAVPLFSGVVYTQVYNATITTFPQAFFLVTIAAQLIVMAILGAIQCSLKGTKLDDGETPPANADQPLQKSPSNSSIAQTSN